ncbi:putative e set [Golovinomyces cichoracearum]|uniref:Putative e set n=1 Tax=Golovinomyces cichoracearum TaxID=62708 RepID=A0A420HLK5_9PEZI|nr:putative e set [Golovinomyces cichoracearum]
MSTWVIANLSGLSVQVGSSFDGEGTEIVLNHSLWEKFLLPNTVAPSFNTCNIERNYQLDIRSQTINLPLQLPISICSGLSPNLSSAIVNRSAGTQNFAPVEDQLPSYEEIIAHETVISAP